MRRIAATLIALIACAPFVAVAQTSDDVILDLLRSLEGPVGTTASISATAAASAALSVEKPVLVVQQPASTSIPQQSAIMNSFTLFNVDGNAPRPDPNVLAMRSALDALVAQLAALTASKTQAPPVPAATTTEATTTAEVVPPPPQRAMFKKDLKQGSRGDEVKQLQELLIARGYLFGEATGYFGILTRTALITFQEERGLPGVGTVGPKTRALLNTLPLERMSVVPPPLTLGLPAIPFISSSTSAVFNASSTDASSTPMFDSFAAPVSVSMSLLPTEAPVGGSTAITWISQNATSCDASDGWSGSKPTLGAARIEPLQFSLNFVITCTGPGGIASTSALVVVGGEQ